MHICFLFVCLFPGLAKAQVIAGNGKESDPAKMQIQKNIFRVLLSAATDTKFSMAANYEREIKKPFTLFVKGGPAGNREVDGTDASGETKYNWVFNVFASAEFRYYYNLKRRARLQKTVRNFTAFYFSLEQQIVSNPIYIINKSGNQELKGTSRAFINMGYQYQKSTTCYNVYFGTRFPGSVYSNISSGIELLHAGVKIGRAF